VEHSEPITIFDSLAATDTIKAQLREMIAVWSARHPDRIIMQIPMRTIPLLAGGMGSKLSTLAQLDGYVGAALPDGPVRIPWSYELHTLLFSEAIEVLMLSNELEAHPLRRLADEVAQLALDRSKPIDIDEVFDFTVPMSVLTRVEKMRRPNRAQFRAILNRRLIAVGLSAHHGSINGGLEIRKNR